MSESIGTTLKEARRRLGLRVKDVAARTSARISASYLSCIENDLRYPSEELLLELADLLGLDRRELYLRLVRAKAPTDLRETLFAPASAEDPRYASARKLSLEQLIDRAHDATEARRELKELQRELALREASGPLSAGRSYVERWQADADRYRMMIEKTVVEADIAIDGDATIIRHVLGLEPRPGRPALFALQHTARVPISGSADDDGFKLLEQPEDVSVEVERRPLGAEQNLLRISFPEGLAWQKGRDRRVSYVFRSILRGAFSLERRTPERSIDPWSNERGDRSSVVIAVDKPSRELEIEVRFPRYYLPDELSAWAGTQDFYEAEDNFIDQGVAQSWIFETRDDWRARLRVVRPLVGMKYGITWRPLYQEEFKKVKERLEIDPEEKKP